MIHEVIDRDVEAVLSSLMDPCQMIQRVKDRDDPEEPEPIVFVVVKVRFLISTLLMYVTLKAYGL